jgi:hypothetical protein
MNSASQPHEELLPASQRDVLLVRFAPACWIALSAGGSRGRTATMSVLRTSCWPNPGHPPAEHR